MGVSTSAPCAPTSPGGGGRRGPRARENERSTVGLSVPRAREVDNRTRPMSTDLCPLVTVKDQWLVVRCDRSHFAVENPVVVGLHKDVESWGNQVQS